MVSRGKVLFGVVAALLLGVFLSSDAFRVLRAWGAPIVTGDVIARAPIKVWSIPSADFTIHIHGSGEEVHARTAGYLLNTVPQVVQFHYAGDPKREVFLFEHEENPIWIILFAWSVAAFLILLLSPWQRLDRMRHSLGWTSR